VETTTFSAKENDNSNLDLDCSALYISTEQERVIYKYPFQQCPQVPSRCSAKIQDYWPKYFFHQQYQQKEVFQKEILA
jgi:hypothetical protein